MKNLMFKGKKILAVCSTLALVLALVLTLGVSAGTEATSNLLTSEGLTNGTQSVTAYRLSGVDCSDLWNMSFGANTYTNAVATAIGYSSGAVENLTDGRVNDVYNLDTKYVQYDYDYAPTSASALQRRALLIDLGAAKDLDSVQIHMAQQWNSGGLKNNAVYDCSVYAGNTATVTDLLKADNFVANYTSSEYKREANIALTGVTNVQYVLVVFNKISNDVGCTNTEVVVTTYGALRLAEIAVNGTPYVAPANLLTSDGLTDSTQSVAAYRLSGVDCSDLWNMSFGANTYANAVASGIGYMAGTVTNLVDGKKDNVYNANTDYVQYDYDYAATSASALQRRAVLIDLGAAKDLDSVQIHMAQQWNSGKLHNNAVYDCSIYAGNNSAVGALLQAENFVTNYTSDSYVCKADISVSGTKNVRYVLIVFNKISNDVGCTNTTVVSSTYGALRLAELSINGWAAQVEEEEEEEVVLTTPATLGATVNTNSSSEIRFGAQLPAELPQGYTIAEYGTLVIPNQLLAEGAELLYDTQYAAKAVYEGETAVLGAEYTVDLKGSSQGVYPGVKFAARSYVVYEDANGEQTTVYGETCVRSVWAVAQQVAAKLIENKASLTLVYTSVVTDQVSVQDVLAAKSTASITKADVYAFVCQNVAAVEALQNMN